MQAESETQLLGYNLVCEILIIKKKNLIPWMTFISPIHHTLLKVPEDIEKCTNWEQTGLFDPSCLAHNKIIIEVDNAVACCLCNA